MRSRMRFALTVLAMMALPAAASAEPTGSYFEVTPFGGFTFFDGDIRAHLGAPITDDIYFGGRVGWQWKPWLGVEVAGGFTPSTFDTSTGGDVDFFHYSGNLMFTPWSGRAGSFFAFAGFGSSQLSPSGGDELKQGNLEFGVGTRFWLSDAIGLRFEVRHVPGHSPGHVMLYVADAGVAFVGDVVFAGSIGRTDLPGGDFQQLMQSIREHVLSLPDETVLYPGHGPSTTVGHERVANPFLTPQFGGGLA